MGNLFLKINQQVSNNIKKEQFVKEDFNISVDEFNLVLVKCGYKKIDDDLAKTIIKYLAKGTNNLNEASMLLAHMIHETGGFVYREELFALNNPEEAKKAYSGEKGLKSKSYHGRGFIMLSYPDNYMNASIGLGMDDTLLKQPEMVAESDELCIRTALWYWNNVVKKSRNVCDNNFNASTLEINGPIERTGEGRKKAKHRLDLYQTIAKELKVKNISKK
ncbi:hypothetical protein BDAP_000193 [Binucleata daphniae]